MQYLTEERCTQATLKAFNIDACPVHGTGVIEKLQNAGWKYKLINTKGIKLEDFIKSHKKGKYYISTAGHSMALINGKLTDTAKGTGKRKIQVALEVYK